MLRRICVYLVLCVIACSTLLLASTTAVHSQTDAEVYVTDLVLDKDTYKSGEYIRGSFILSNAHPEMNVPDVMYEVSLVGNFASNGIPQVFYDTKTFGPEFLKTGEQNKLIRLDNTYKLPETFAGEDLGIHVQAVLKSGLPLGFADARINVTGGLDRLNVVDADVVLDGVSFPTNAGPMVYENTKATLDVTISNPNTSSLDLTPHVVIYDRTPTGTVLKTYDEKDIIVAKGTQQKLSYPLYTFNYKPGVYLGEMTFVDSSGISRTPTLYFRYIVAGDIATITGVTTKTTSVIKGNLIDLTLNYSGTPYDIQTGNMPAQSDLEIDMKVFNEHDRMVAIYKSKMNFNEGTSKNLVLKSLDAAAALRVNVVVTKAGEIIDTYSTNLSPDYDAIRAEAKKKDSSIFSKISWSLVIPIVAVIILIIGFLAFRKKMFGRNLSVFMVGILVAGGMFVSGTHKVEAFTIATSTNHSAVWNYIWDFGQAWNPNTPNQSPGTSGYAPFHPVLKPWLTIKNASYDFIPRVTVNSPTNNQKLNPGQRFYVQGTLIAFSCLNTPQDMMIKVTFNNTTKTQYFSTVNNVNTSDIHGHADSRSMYYSVGPFTVPSTTGPTTSYNIIIHAENYTNLPNRTENVAAKSVSQYKATPPFNWSNGTEVGTAGGEVTGYQRIQVVNATPRVDLNANPTMVNYNTSSNLTWTSANATGCSATGDWNGPKPINGSGTTGNLTSAKSYTITCTGPGGTAVDTVTVGVRGSQEPIVTLTASPATIQVPQNSNLIWTSQHATSCTASSNPIINPQNGNWTGNITPVASGNRSVSPTVTTVFTLTCVGPGGTASKSTTVNVTVPSTPPTVDLVANPATVNKNESSALKWTSTNATTCSSSQFPTGNATQNTTGVSTGNLANTTSSTKTYTYVITCTGPGGSATDTVTVNVLATHPSVSVNLTSDAPFDSTLNAYKVTAGSRYNLRWAPANAESCMGSVGFNNPSGGFGWPGGKSNTYGSLLLTALTPPGQYQFSINCIGGGQNNTARDTVTIDVIDEVFTISCKAEKLDGTQLTPPNTIQANVPVRWVATVSAATGIRSYEWSGIDFPLPPDNTGNPFVFSTGYETAGTKTAQVKVTLTNGSSKTWPCTSLTSKAAPIFIEI